MLFKSLRFWNTLQLLPVPHLLRLLRLDLTTRIPMLVLADRMRYRFRFRVYLDPSAHRNVMILESVRLTYPVASLLHRSVPWNPVRVSSSVVWNVHLPRTMHVVRMHHANRFRAKESAHTTRKFYRVRVLLLSFLLCVCLCTTILFFVVVVCVCVILHREYDNFFE